MVCLGVVVGVFCLGFSLQLLLLFLGLCAFSSSFFFFFWGGVFIECFAKWLTCFSFVWINSEQLLNDMLVGSWGNVDWVEHALNIYKDMTKNI